MRRFLHVSFIIFSVSCLASGAFALSPLIDEEARATVREELDLQAQQEMVLWTQRTFFVSAAAAVISVLGLGGLLLSLAQTRKALRVGFLDQRPWLVVSDVSFDLVSLGNWVPHDNGQSFKDSNAGSRLHLHGYFTITNIGKSPAFNVMQAHRILNTEQPEGTDPRDQFQHIFKGVLIPGESERITIMRDVAVKGTTATTDDLGNVMATFAVKYGHFASKERLETEITAFLVEAQTKEEQDKNYAPMALTRSALASGHFPGVGLQGQRTVKMT